MPFPESVRRWTKKISGDKCQTHVYSEKRGYQICGGPAEEIDHIDPEGFVLDNGGDPNNDSIPIPRCKKHHRGVGLVVDNGQTRFADFGEENWSRHADVGIALAREHKGQKGALKRALELHHEKTQRGVKYWNADDGVDEYEREHMKDLIEKGRREGNGRPKVKPHRNLQKRKKWYDGLF